jgi:drug/metabolite transporter (DMT)-like permease
MTQPTTVQRKAHLDPFAIAMLVLCCFLWGLNQVAAKAAMPEVPALWQAASRSIGGAVLIALWARWRGIPVFTLRDATLRGGLLAGALFGVEFLCIFIGLQFTTASRMVVFIYISPFVVALGMPFISHSERLSPRQIVGLLIAFAGVAWAFEEGFTKPAAGAHQLLGDALGVAAGVIWGATTLAIRGTKLSTASAEKTLLYQLAVSGFILAIAALASGAKPPTSLSNLAWAAMGFQIVIVSAFSYLLWFGLIGRYPATKLASFTLLTPVFGLLMGALLLNEPITTRLVIAVIAVAAGIVLVNRRA